MPHELFVFSLNEDSISLPSYISHRFILPPKCLYVPHPPSSPGSLLLLCFRGSSSLLPPGQLLQLLNMPPTPSPPPNPSSPNHPPRWMFSLLLLVQGDQITSPACAGPVPDFLSCHTVHYFLPQIRSPNLTKIAHYFPNTHAFSSASDSLQSLHTQYFPFPVLS